MSDCYKDNRAASELIESSKKHTQQLLHLPSLVGRLQNDRSEKSVSLHYQRLQRGGLPGYPPDTGDEH
jgi:hypothetical protein